MIDGGMDEGRKDAVELGRQGGRERASVGVEDLKLNAVVLI